MTRSRHETIAVTCAVLVACGSPRDARPTQPTAPAGHPAAAGSDASASVTVALPAPAPVPPIVSWDHLALAERHTYGGQLFPVRATGVLEPHGVVAVAQGRIDVYAPSSTDPIASTSNAKLGFDISAATDSTFGTAAELLWLAAPAREQIVALDAMTLVERFALPAPKGTRVHKIGEAADIVWLDIVYPTGPELLAVDPRTGRERWRVPKVLGALSAAGDRIVAGSASGLTAYDAHTGAVAWTRTTDPDHDTKVVGEKFTVVETKDETAVDVVATADGHALAHGTLDRVVPYDNWIIADDMLYAAVVTSTSTPTRTHIVAWDPQTAKPAWTALDRASFVAESGTPSLLLATRRELFFLDAENSTVTALDRSTSAVRWQRGFDAPTSIVFANDGHAALYVEDLHGIAVLRPSATLPVLEHATIRGVVTYDQKPRAGAQVRASCGIETRTDARGRFTLTCDAEGAITVSTLVTASRAQGCNPYDVRDETIVLEGKQRYEIDLPLGSTCGD